VDNCTYSRERERGRTESFSVNSKLITHSTFTRLYRTSQAFGFGPGQSSLASSITYVFATSPPHSSACAQLLHPLLAVQVSFLIRISLTAASFWARYLHASSPLHASSSTIKFPAVFELTPGAVCNPLQAKNAWHAFFPMKIFATIGDVVAPWLAREPTSLHALSSMHAPSSTRMLPKTFFPTPMQACNALLQARGPITLYPTSTSAAGCIGSNHPSASQGRLPLQLSSMIVSGRIAPQAREPLQDPLLEIRG